MDFIKIADKMNLKYFNSLSIDAKVETINMYYFNPVLSGFFLFDLKKTTLNILFYIDNKYRKD